MVCCCCVYESSGSEMWLVLHLIIRKCFKFIYDLKAQLFFSIKEIPLVFLKLIGLFDKETYQGMFQFSCSVMSNSLWPHGLQHARLPCPSPTPGACSNSCPLSQWCHPTTSSSVILFSFCPQSFPASGSFPVSQLFAWGGQSVGVSASSSVLPMNTQDWSPLGWTGWISLQSKGLLRVFSNTTVQKHQFFGTHFYLYSNIHTWLLDYLVFFQHSFFFFFSSMKRNVERKPNLKHQLLLKSQKLQPILKYHI